MIKAAHARALAKANPKLLSMIESKIKDAAEAGLHCTIVETTSYKEAVNARVRLIDNGYSVRIYNIDDGMGTYYEMNIYW